MRGEILVAGIGNMFLGDDGFGPEVISRLLAEGPPPDDLGAEAVVPEEQVADAGYQHVHIERILRYRWRSGSDSTSRVAA